MLLLSYEKEAKRLLFVALFQVKRKRDNRNAAPKKQKPFCFFFARQKKNLSHV
jgi:hypothetical protein